MTETMYNGSLVKDTTTDKLYYFLQSDGDFVNVSDRETGKEDSILRSNLIVIEE